MSKLRASLIACLLSGLVSGMLAQQLAVRSGAGEEFIVVFIALGAALLIAGLCFLVAQFFGRRGIDRTGAGLMVMTVVALAALWILIRDESTTPESRSADFSMLAYLGVPVLVLIAAQWITVRVLAR